MKHSKRVLIGTIILAIFMVNMVAPASAYSYAGWHFPSGSVYYSIDSTVPSSWSTAISNAKNVWNNAGSSFRFYVGSSSSKLYYAGLSDDDILALTWRHGSNFQLTYCETYFNNNLAWSTSGAPGYFDVQNVATHEFGHWLRLEDLYDSGDYQKTMYGRISLGEIMKRDLHSDDIAGIRHIYP